MNPRRILPAWLVVILDILAVGAALCVFALFHHVLPKVGTGPVMDIVDAAVWSNTAAAMPESKPNTGAAAQSGAQTPIQLPDLSSSSAKEGFAKDALYAYESDNVRIAVREVQDEHLTYYVSDIWVKNISSLRTAFAKDQYGQGIHQDFLKIGNNHNAILAISGDYYGARAKGVVIRNGKLYRNTPFEDVCVLYMDGVMETYTKDEFNIDDAVSRQAYQAWCFGPQLLDNGAPMEKFTSTVSSPNPRCAIGYYEPGHYCFVTVDGRQKGYSDGITLKDLSKLFYDLGCKAAYNLDGGQTAMMSFKGALVNQPYKGGRQSSDIIYIAE